MVAVPANPTPPPGNPIVPTPTQQDFPTLALGAMVVGVGIYLLSEANDHAAWMLTILLLLAIAYAQRNFATEITSLLSGK